MAPPQEEEDSEDDTNTAATTVGEVQVEESKQSKANQIIDHWRNRLAEKAKEIYLPENYNGGRPRFNSIDPERAKEYKRLLNYDERSQILKHPQHKPKGGQQRSYLRVLSQGRLWSDKVRYEAIKPLDEDDLKRIVSL